MALRKHHAPNAALLVVLGISGMRAIPSHAETPSPAVAAPAHQCSDAEFRQFDFWVGRWNVVDTGTRAPAGSSLIESLYDGCAIRENWSEPALTGGGLMSYNPVDKRWRQTWVDSSGGRRDFVGGREGGHMVLVYTHPSVRVPGATARERIIFTANSDGSVQQYSDASLDGGKSWVLRYDYTYLPSAASGLPEGATTEGSPRCSTPEQRQFDFWVGRWNVSNASKPDVKVAESLIENLYAGCAIRENWMPRAAGGGSLSTYDAATRRWVQTWVDSSGARVDFNGGWNGSAMVLTGLWPQPDHPHQLTRMTYTVIADGAVRQLGETSDDEGATWQPSFDFIYRRSEGPVLRDTKPG